MQSLASFFEENRLLASGAVLAAVVVLLIVVTLLYRLVFGRRPRAAANGRIDRGDLTKVLKLLGVPMRDWVG